MRGQQSSVGKVTWIPPPMLPHRIAIDHAPLVWPKEGRQAVAGGEARGRTVVEFVGGATAICVTASAPTVTLPALSPPSLDPPPCAAGDATAVDPSPSDVQSAVIDVCGIGGRRG